MKFLTLIVCFMFSMFCNFAYTQSTEDRTDFHILASYPVAGVGAHDALTYNEASKRLYVSHGPDVAVLDAITGAIVGRVHTTSGAIHSIAVVPQTGLGFASGFGPGFVSVFKLDTLAITAEVRADDPDAIVYDPASGKVLAMSAGLSTAIDAKTGEKIGEFHLGGAPEGASSDGHGKAYVNVVNRNSVAVIDTHTLEVLHSYPTEACTSPHTMNYDAANDLLFVGCRNGALDVIEAATGKVIARTLIGSEVDGAAFDPATRRLFFSCGEGVVNVLQQRKRDEYDLLQTVRTEIGTKTMAYDPIRHYAYIAASRFEDEPTKDPLKFTHIHLPDSLHLLVVGEK